jgi:hypothetical protein
MIDRRGIAAGLSHVSAERDIARVDGGIRRGALRA